MINPSSNTKTKLISDPVGHKSTGIKSEKQRHLLAVCVPPASPGIAIWLPQDQDSGVVGLDWRPRETQLDSSPLLYTPC